MIVAKFGGSSCASAKQFYKIKKIVESNPQRKVIVVSAPGKDENHPHKITDLLYLVYELRQQNEDYLAVFDEVSERFKTIQLELGLEESNELELFKERFKQELSLDEVVSLGEKMSAQILARYLNYRYVDAREVIKLHEDGTIHQELSFEKIQKKVHEEGNCVIPGFYGETPLKKIKVLARGGSDITGALCTAALNASVYENWTDVSGILMADPRIIPYAKSIVKMSFAELREMAFMGASVLHESSISPIMHKNIPLNIKNTNEPDHPGTFIYSNIPHESKSNHFITGVSGLKDFTVISIHKEEINKSPRLFRDILEIFEEYQLPLELINKGINSFTLTIKTSKVNHNLNDLFNSIEDKIHPDRIQLEDQLALITCVGRKMKYQAGVSGQIFSALGKHNINIRSIAQGTDEISILVGVDNKDFEESIRLLYEQFIA